MKSKSRLGKADSIFASTAAKPAPPVKKIEAAARSSIEDKMTIIMPPNQVAFLDRLCLDIRSKTGSKVRRTEIIRALVAGIEAAGIDLTAYGSEEALTDAIRKRIKGV